MTVLITLSSSGASSGPLYDLYSNIDYVTPLASGVTKLALQGGYSLSGVPDAATTIRITSTGPTCTNSIDVTITGNTTTTTTTAGCTITSSIVLAQGTSSVDACTNFGTPANRATYYTFDGSSFASTNGLNQTPICTQRASSGWYSNGIISRYFDNATGNFNTPVGC
jgi:hypothetical protein